jgi:F-type H+-transporting ATPase subunit a
MQNLNIALSPLDQFEIRDLVSVNVSILDNSQISISNIGLYLTISTIIITLLSILATNYNKLIPNA